MPSRALRPRATLAFCFTLFLVAANGAVPQKDAQASVSIAVLFDALVGDTTTACIATPTEQHAIWEGGRIVTYTRVHIDNGIAGELGTGKETWVVTLGGIVGDVGQTVEGEASLHIGLPSLLFLRPDPSATGGAHIVTARAQGQFHVRVDPKTRLQTFRTSPAMGVLYPPPASMVQRVKSTTLASDVIANSRPVADVAKDIAAAWTRTHAK